MVGEKCFIMLEIYFLDKNGVLLHFLERYLHFCIYVFYPV